jgi:DNA-binding NarL/FixJ family response regulator
MPSRGMATQVTLIGRRSELEAIEGVVDTARGGRSGVLVVRGVPGVGKTALLDAAVPAAPEFRVLRADGVEAESELAFAGLHQLLRPLLGLIDRLPAVQRAALRAALGLEGEVRDRFLVGTGALGLLAEAAEEQPVLCVVDDMQWLDRPSADALVFAARRLEAEPVALLLAVREGTAGPAGLERFAALVLGGLGRDDARALLESHGRLAPAERERLLDAAEGIPLALLELPRGTAGASMGAVERSFAERVAALPEPARRAMLLAAADDDPGAVTALGAMDVATLAPAEAGGLLWVDGERLAFRHPLVRSAAYGLAPFAERRQAHAALAEALTSAADADRRAWHLAAAAAGPDAEVADELARSADRARARGGHAAAAAALERAARLTSADRLRASRLVQAAEAARLAGDADHALALASEGRDNGADEEVAVEATAIRGAVRARRGDPENAEDDLWDAARALAPRHPNRAARVALLAGEAAALRGHHERAIEIARWLATVPRVDGGAERAIAAFARGLSRAFAGDPAGAHDGFMEGVRRAERAGDPQVLLWTAGGAVYAGDLAEGRRAFAAGVALARERGAVGTVAWGLQWVANLDLILGRFGTARTDASEGLALAQECGDESVAANLRALLAWHAAIRGWEDESRGLAREVHEWSAHHSIRFAAESAARALALLDLGLGNHDAALDRLAAMLADPGAHPARRLLVVGDLVEAAAGAGRPDAAEGPLAALSGWARATGSSWATAIAAGAAVQLAADADAAEAAYARAIDAHAAIALPFDRARTELRLGEHLRRARRRVDARRHLRAALDGFAEAGAETWERRAAEELRATGETARKRDASTLDQLTPQEQQIARLAAEGATNRDIAGRLFLSPRTVEYHLRKVFQKLSVSTRTQLAGLDW